MAHIIQVGLGSGGMPVLDAVCRDPRIEKVTLIEPDFYKAHNVERHLFPMDAIGQSKISQASQWLKQRRPELEVEMFDCDLMDEERQSVIENAVASADLGICAVDNEPAKFHWDRLMRQHHTPWTLGEVLSGGIGGFVHWFIPGGACYGCVGTHLKRSVSVDKPPTPDYSQPEGPVHETTIPASMASIHAIASIHALVTLQLLNAVQLEERTERIACLQRIGFTSMLMTLQQVPDVFDEAFKPFKFTLDRNPQCLICSEQSNLSGEELDQALQQAMSRLNDD